MLDFQSLRLALRTRITSLSVLAPTSATLAAAATGFTRSAGSFLTDGLRAGMEVVPTGFADVTPRVIESVVAGAVVVRGGGVSVEAAGAGRSLVVGLPALRAWENKQFDPTEGRPYVEEDLLPGPPPQLVAGSYSNSTIETLPMYVIRWYHLEDTGTAGIEKCIHELMQLFKAGYTLGDAASTKVRGDIMPSRSRLSPDKPGWTVCTVTIPLRAYTMQSA